MPIEELRLDDLTWEDLVAAARSRIPAASRGRWTLHAPVDPGITLLELFAAQLEERLYWLDQPCDTRARAILSLLGVKPLPAIAAATVLGFYSKDPVFTPIELHTAISPQPAPWAPTRSPRDASEGPTFTTWHPILCFPTELENSPRGERWSSKCVELVVGGQDRTLELQKGKAPRLWIDDGGDLDVDIILRLRAPLPKDAKGFLSLLLDVETPEAILPQWRPGATAPPADAEVAWSFGSEANGFRSFDPKAVMDGTKRLRRSGVVRLPVRGDMNWLPVDGNRYQIRMSLRHAHYMAPPRLKQIVPNAVIAHHRQRFGSTSENATNLADELKKWNHLQTPHPTWSFPLADAFVLPQTVGLWLECDGAQRFEAWHAVDDLVYCGPGDPHFSVDREMSELRFGDGYHGRLPVGECTRARLRYHVGGGRSGNLAAGRDWQADRRNVFAVNVVPAEGGADPETLADAAKRAAHEWQQPTRTVTAADFEHLACHVPGAAIGRARAAIGHHPQYPCTSVEGAVTVFVVPDVPQPTREEWLASPLTWSALAPDRPTLELVRAELDKRRLVTQEVFVSAPIYEDIFVTVWIGGVPVNADRVREDVTLAMFRRFHSLWGGDDGTGWPFGEDVFPSAVMKHAQQALDDGLIVTRVSIAGRCGQATQCEPFPIGPLGLPSLKRIQLRFAPTPQTEGGLG